MKAFVKTAVPLVCLCIAGLLYNVIGNVSDTMKVSVQSKALSSLDDALQAAAEDNEPYPRASYVSNVKGVKMYLKKKGKGKVFCGDEIDRKLVRDFVLISYRQEARGLADD